MQSSGENDELQQCLLFRLFNYNVSLSIRAFVVLGLWKNKHPSTAQRQLCNLCAFYNESDAVHMRYKLSTIHLRYSDLASLWDIILKQPQNMRIV
ncbi:hypothetical protein CEXT_478071 [Caerostris extrusa]|uniref:Uncharacterized protein n=1 Tax=Caerostris extrusa TaxID=172846 RepID=A0AAV4TQ18_CAEEX|nr:hypothetical protein CEXT_478071 [Caerostris extrusa]